MRSNIHAFSLKRYTREEKEKIRDRIRELKTQNLPFKEIVDTLNNENFKTPHGLPINLDFLRNQIWRMRKKETLPKSQNQDHPICKIRKVMESRMAEKNKLSEIRKILKMEQA